MAMRWLLPLSRSLELGRTGRAGLAAFVERLQSGGRGEAGVFQTGIQPLIFAGIKTAGTGTTIGQIYTVLAEHTDLGTPLQRQGVCFVFQQGEAFLRHLEVQRLSIPFPLPGGFRFLVK